MQDWKRKKYEFWKNRLITNNWVMKDEKWVRFRKIMQAHGFKTSWS